MFPSCEVCKKIFCNKSSLIRHSKQFHDYKRPTKISRVKVNDVNNTKYKPNSESKSDLTDLDLDLKPAKRECIICHAKFRSRQSLYMHKRRKHGHLINNKTNPFAIEMHPVIEKSVNIDVGENDCLTLNTIRMSEQKGLNVCNYSLNDCEKATAEIADKVKILNRRQLEILICILSREVCRLELLHSTCIKEHNNKSYMENGVKCDEIATERGLNNIHSAFEIHAAKEGLRIVEDQAKSQLDVVNTTDGQLVYSKSWFQIEAPSVSEHSLPTTESSQGGHENHINIHTEQETETAVNGFNQTPQSKDCDRTKYDNREFTGKDLSSTKEPAPIKPESVHLSVKSTSSRYRMILPKPNVNYVKVLNLSTVNLGKVLITSTKVCSETKTFVCEICEKIFSYKNVLNKHLNVVHNYNRITTLCSYCGKLVLQSRLKAHIEKVHEKPKLSCHICHKGFHRRDCLEGHLNKHSNTKPYICEFCGRKYGYYTSLIHHKGLCARALLPPHLHNFKSKEDKGVSCICESCGITFVGTSGLKDHYRAKHMNQVQTCTHCGKNFHWRPSYNRHVKKCRERTDLERTKLRKLAASSPGKTFICECGKQYPYRQSFRRHQKTCLQNQQLDSYVKGSKSIDKISLSEYLQ